jgi:hypothetical protein
MQKQQYRFGNHAAMAAFATIYATTSQEPSLGISLLIKIAG